jgi:hypothetical protein
VLFRTVLVAVVSATTLMLSGGIAHADSDDAGMIKLGHMMPLSPASQENAVRKAKQYLDYTAFSHDGLINQLVDAEHFSTDDATYAVDSLNVDWNQQAAKKAKQYLNYTAFSHDGLINQLIDAEKFTPSQAEYGVAAAGL